MSSTLRRFGLFAALLLAVAALGIGFFTLRFWIEHGRSDPARYDAPIANAGQASKDQVSYRRQVEPILHNRCVVCHACYDAPCQLKLGSWEGIARGFSPALVFNGERVSEAPLTRLFTDAQKASQWREKGFSPVLNEYRDSPEQNRALSLIWRTLALKRANPQPASGPAPDALDFGANRKQSCPKIETFDFYQKTHPLAGMPFGLPGIDLADEDLIVRWIEQGAPDEGPPPLSGDEKAKIAEWEHFLNGDSFKERLMSRFLYEHLFLAQLYLNDAGDGPAFRLVRSATPPGQPISIVATRRPFDAPGVKRVYYRLQGERDPIVAKTHMPYRFDRARIDRYRALFLAPDYAVEGEPTYAAREASNGLSTFRDIPEDSRYRFMLDDAQFFIMTFIKGPVCKGQVALNVIEDRFWVFFLDPRASLERDANDVARRALERIDLPAADGSDSTPLLAIWNDYAARERQYQQARATSLRALAAKHGGPRLDIIWDGGGANPNAALTVMRHFDNATVVRGLVGVDPKTAWVLDYSLFERIYYLLAAGFDVYGNLTHYLDSRLYMDFLRMEGEANFISLLPAEARAPTISHWYRDAKGESLDQMRALTLDPSIDTAINFHSADPAPELLDMLKQRLSPSLDTQLLLANTRDAVTRERLEDLAGVRGKGLAFFPELSYLVVVKKQGAADYFSIVRDTGHLNVTHLLTEKNELAPDENALTVIPGLIGAYPNAFFRLEPEQLPEFVQAVAAIRADEDYQHLVERFAVRRTNPDFWKFSDQLQAEEARSGLRDRGLLDYNRLENR
jgi:hypothetical protein